MLIQMRLTYSICLQLFSPKDIPSHCKHSFFYECKVYNLQTHLINFWFHCFGSIKLLHNLMKSKLMLCTVFHLKETWSCFLAVVYWTGAFWNIYITNILNPYDCYWCNDILTVWNHWTERNAFRFDWRFRMIILRLII